MKFQVRSAETYWNQRMPGSWRERDDPENRTGLRNIVGAPQSKAAPAAGIHATSICGRVSGQAYTERGGAHPC